MLRTVVEPREVWRLCTRHGGYLVSDLGRVRRIGGRILKPWPSQRGYLYVDLGGKLRGQAVHQLVAEAFHGARPAGHEVDHLDWQRTNNAATNLRYLRRAENAVRWASRAADGRNVWATPDDDLEPPDGLEVEPLTPEELAELARVWGPDPDREEAVA